jgi:hypothetical protein
MTFDVRACLRASIVTGSLFFLSTPALAAGTSQTAPPSTANSTATTASVCSGTHGCTSMLLSLLNLHRERHHLAPLQLTPVQSNGRSGCPGSYGHSVAMATTGGIWHTNDRYPRQSFPHNICVRYSSVGENVGEAFTGTESVDIHVLDQMMMNEPHSAGVCAATYNHACNILNSAYHFVGIGLFEHNGTTWLTEDFIG